jgi:hypothetical protein
VGCCLDIPDAICLVVSPAHKPLVFLSGVLIKTPPLTAAARLEVGYLLRTVAGRGDVGAAAVAPDAVHRSALPRTARSRRDRHLAPRVPHRPEGDRRG